MKTTKQIEKDVTKLIAMFPSIKGIKPLSEWSGDEDDRGIHLGDAAEGGMINGLMAADFYNEFTTSETHDDFGIHKDLDAACTNLGYGLEWYDAGTLVCYAN